VREKGGKKERESGGLSRCDWGGTVLEETGASGDSLFPEALKGGREEGRGKGKTALFSPIIH